MQMELSHEGGPPLLDLSLPPAVAQIRLPFVPLSRVLRPALTRHLCHREEKLHSENI